MAGQSSSLGVLAAIANEHRVAIANEQRAALAQAQRAALLRSMEAAASMPLVQAARPMVRGTVPLLARQLLLPKAAATNQFAFSLPSSQLVAPKLSVANLPTNPSFAGKPKLSTPACARPAAVTKPAAAVAAKPATPPIPPPPSPKKYLQDMFAEMGIGEAKMPKRFVMGDFVKPDDDECESYNEAARFVRTNDLEKVRALHKEGKNLDACNRVGESLLHLACRRGHVAMAEFLMTEAKVRWDMRDDFGRTILHDACWRPTASVELMEAILKVVSPEWLMAEDVRGHTPFDYARRHHAATWYAFLQKKEELLKRRLSLLT